MCICVERYTCIFHECNTESVCLVRIFVIIFECSEAVRTYFTYLIKWRKDLIVKECCNFSRKKVETG